MIRFFRPTLFIISSIALNGNAGDWQLLPFGNYGYGEIYGNSSIKWYLNIPPDVFGVITLKNKGGRSDIDVFAYSSSSKSTELGKGVNSGRSNEIVILAPEEYSRYAYVEIRNIHDAGTNYQLFFHTVDYAAKAGEAFAKAGLEALLIEMLGVSQDNKAQADIGRASTLLFSALKEENLANTTKSMFLNELTMAMKEEFGYGFLGNLIVNYVVLMADEILKNYW